MPCRLLSEILSAPGIRLGDIFQLPGSFVRSPHTGEILPYPQLHVVSRIEDGRIWFNPRRDADNQRDAWSLPEDDMQGAFNDWVIHRMLIETLNEAAELQEREMRKRLRDRRQAGLLEFVRKQDLTPRRWFQTPELLQWRFMQSADQYEDHLWDWPMLPSIEVKP